MTVIASPHFDLNLDLDDTRNWKFLGIIINEGLEAAGIQLRVGMSRIRN